MPVRSLSWFNLCQQLSPPQALTQSPHAGMGERIRKVKIKKLKTDRFTGKAQAACARKAKQGIHSTLPWAVRCSAIHNKAAFHHP